MVFYPVVVSIEDWGKKEKMCIPHPSRRYPSLRRSSIHSEDGRRRSSNENDMGEEKKGSCAMEGVREQC